MLWPGINEVLRSLESYCRIRSGTQNKEGVLKAQQFLAPTLESLGFLNQFIENELGTEASAPLLLGKRRGSKTGPRITLVSHADTLDGAHLDQQRYTVEVGQDRIIGQGVLDDKASQYVALWGLMQHLNHNPDSCLNISFVSSPNEELGSQGFHQFYQKLSEEQDVLLGFEPSLPNGDIVSSRRGNRWYDIEVIGREAHAGRRHGYGCNAAHELSIKISKLHRLTKYRKNITVNIGEIKTNSSTYNVVCGKAWAKLDTRFSTLKDRDLLHKEILSILDRSYLKSKDDGFRTECNYTLADDCPPLHRNQKSKRLAKQYLSLIRDIENNPKLTDQASGGGADVCYMAHKGLVVLDGLGATGDKMHRVDEYASISSLESRSKAFAQLLDKLNINQLN